MFSRDINTLLANCCGICPILGTVQNSSDKLNEIYKTVCVYQAEGKFEQPTMEEHALKNINNCLNTNIYSYLETSGGQTSNLYLHGVHFFNASVN